MTRCFTILDELQYHSKAKLDYINCLYQAAVDNNPKLCASKDSGSRDSAQSAVFLVVIATVTTVLIGSLDDVTTVVIGLLGTM